MKCKNVIMNASIIMLALISTWSCEHAVLHNGTTSEYFEARKNGEFWRGAAEASYPQYSPEGELVILGIGTNDVIGFRIDFNGAGIYKIDSGKGFYYTTVGGDVVENSYISFGYENDKVTITTSDDKNQTIAGTFALRVKSETDENRILNFESGNFIVKIKSFQ